MVDATVARMQPCSDQIEAITTRLSIAVPDLSTGFAKDAGIAGSNPALGAIMPR
jgi:hypothetical protein